MPTFNRANLVGETLDSIISQTYKNWECILVDDGSEDQTLEVLNQYAKKDDRFKIFSRPNYKIKGANSCRNYGFELAKGDYIKWFDSDDVMRKDLLTEQMKAIECADVCVCKLEYYDFNNDIAIKETSIKSDNVVPDYLIGKITYYISGPLWHRKFLQVHRCNFDENLSNLDDWDFNLRMLYSKPRIRLLEKSLIKYRVHSNSLSQEVVKGNLAEVVSELRARRKHLLLLLFSNHSLKQFTQLIINRNKYYLREALVAKSVHRKFLVKNLLLTYFLSLNISGFLKTAFAYLSFKFFNKGYKLLR